MQVVNKKGHPPTNKDVYIGRPSPLGNRWTHRPDVAAKYTWMTLVPTREEAVRRYKLWLYERIKAQDPTIMAALRSIPHDANLVCWCAPLACHGDVVKAACEWLNKQED